MLIVGENLRGLVVQHDVCDVQLFDENSLKLRIMGTIFAPQTDAPTVAYEQQDYSDLYDRRQIGPEGLDLRPGNAILACSSDTFRMPMGYFGQVQTKGSLARLFVAAHMCDPQIDPGYEGKITLEVVNHGPFTVNLKTHATVASLYIWKCSTANNSPYNGRYNRAKEPTLPLLPGTSVRDL